MLIEGILAKRSFSQGFVFVIEYLMYYLGFTQLFVKRTSLGVLIKYLI